MFFGDDVRQYVIVPCKSSAWGAAAAPRPASKLSHTRRRPAAGATTCRPQSGPGRQLERTRWCRGGGWWVGPCGSRRRAVARACSAFAAAAAACNCCVVGRARSLIHQATPSILQFQAKIIIARNNKSSWASSPHY
jgi:hypothetical protein